MDHDQSNHVISTLLTSDPMLPIAKELSQPDGMTYFSNNRLAVADYSSVKIFQEFRQVSVSLSWPHVLKFKSGDIICLIVNKCHEPNISYSSLS